MAKSKDMETIKLQSGKVVEFHKDFYLNQLVEAIEKSEGIYSCPVHKTVAVGTIKMLFFKFQLTEYMASFEIQKSDYKKWFEQSAKDVGAEKFMYYKLFGDKDGE